MLKEFVNMLICYKSDIQIWYIPSVIFISIYATNLRILVSLLRNFDRWIIINPIKDIIDGECHILCQGIWNIVLDVRLLHTYNISYYLAIHLLCIVNHSFTMLIFISLPLTRNKCREIIPPRQLISTPREAIQIAKHWFIIGNLFLMVFEFKSKYNETCECLKKKNHA